MGLVEQYKNFFTEVLINDAGGISDSDTSFDVDDASLLPSDGNFRLLVEDELMLIGSVSGNTLSGITRGIEGTTAAVHVDGTVCTLVLTAQGLIEIKRKIAIGYRDDHIDSSEFTQINFGASTIDDTDGVLNLQTPSGAVSISLLVKALPSAPYIITIPVWFHSIGGTACAGGLFLRDSGTGKLTSIALLESDTVEIQKWDSPTLFNSNYGSTTQWREYSKPVYLQIEDDSVNRIYRIGHDRKAMRTIHTVGNTDFLTPDQYGFGINPQGSGPVRILTVYSSLIE